MGDVNTDPAPPSPTIDEEALIARAKSDPTVVGEIYDLYSDKLFGFLLKRCGHKETAEDLVQRTFLKFLEALPRYEWRGVSIGAWLYRTASNALTDHWRSASSRMDTDLDTDEWDPPSSDQSPAWFAENVLEKEKIAEAMKQLSPRDQEVLDLRFFGEREIEEIAGVMEISANHASVLIYRAVGRLRSKYVKLFGNELTIV